MLCFLQRFSFQRSFIYCHLEMIGIWNLNMVVKYTNVLTYKDKEALLTRVFWCH